MTKTTPFRSEWYLNYSKGERVLCVGVSPFALFARGETTIVVDLV